MTSKEILVWWYRCRFGNRVRYKKLAGNICWNQSLWRWEPWAIRGRGVLRCIWFILIFGVVLHTWISFPSFLWGCHAESWSGFLCNELLIDHLNLDIKSTQWTLGVHSSGFRYLPRKAACCLAIQDDELREAVANKFRADMFRGSVLPKYMQKLRAWAVESWCCNWKNRWCATY